MLRNLLKRWFQPKLITSYYRNHYCEALKIPQQTHVSYVFNLTDTDMMSIWTLKQGQASYRCTRQHIRDFFLRWDTTHTQWLSVFIRYDKDETFHPYVVHKKYEEFQSYAVRELPDRQGIAVGCMWFTLQDVRRIREWATYPEQLPSAR